MVPSGAYKYAQPVAPPLHLWVPSAHLHLWKPSVHCNCRFPSAHCTGGMPLLTGTCGSPLLIYSHGTLQFTHTGEALFLVHKFQQWPYY